MRDTQVIELPISKIKAEVITYYTYAEFKQVEGALYKAAKSVRMVGGEAHTDIDGSAISDSTRVAMTLAVKKLTAPDGTDIPVTIEAISELHAKDGMAIETAVDAIDEDMKKK